jgi:hypothetical protein
MRPLLAAVTDVNNQGRPPGRAGRGAHAADRYLAFIATLDQGELRRWERAVLALHEAGHAVVATATGLRVDHVTLGLGAGGDDEDGDDTGAAGAGKQGRFCHRTCPAGPHAAPAAVARWEWLAGPTGAAAVLERWVDRQLDRLAPVGTSPNLNLVVMLRSQCAERLAELAVTFAGLVAVGHVTLGVGALSFAFAGPLSVGDVDDDGAKVMRFRRFLRQVPPEVQHEVQPAPAGRQAPDVVRIVQAVADDFLRQAYCMAATIVDDEWEAVRRVAEALFRDGALSGPQVEALLADRFAAWAGAAGAGPAGRPPGPSRATWARWTGQRSHRPEAWNDYRHEAQDVLNLLDTLEATAAPAAGLEAVEAERSRRRSRRRRPAETPPTDPAHPDPA